LLHLRTKTATILFPIGAALVRHVAKPAGGCEKP
jgi:hypothetical protein